MKTVVAFFLLVLVPFAAAQVTDPHITSWRTASSAAYARVWETASDKASNNAVSTWPRSGLTNGGGGQSTNTYSDVQRVAYSANYVYIYTTGLASYTMGNWLTPNGMTYMSWPTNRGAIHRIPRNPSIPTTKQKTIGNGGVWVNGVFLWENGDAQSYTTSSGTVSMGGQGIWNRLAGVAEAFNFDTANGHQPSSGAYHNHINPIALRYQLGDNINYNASTHTYSEGSTPTRHSPILGWANDGLPVYGPYGYSSALDASSGIRRMTSGFQKRDGTNGTINLAVTGRTTLPVWAASVQGKSQTLSSSEYGPSTTTTYSVGGGVTGTYSIGLFAEDYEYLGDLGKTQGVDFDLNRQNVRYCVTPEYPNGTYAYFVCIDASGGTVFPDVINQEYFGSAANGQGTVNSISESVTDYVDAGPAASITVTATASSGNVSLSWNSAEGATYKVASSTNNSTWTTLSSAVTSAGLTTNYTAATSNYYRVTLTAIAAYDTSGTYGTPVGTTGSVTYLAATTAPGITTQPSSVTVTAGNSASFTVVASGTAPLTYQWSKGGNAISGATSATYSIANAQSSDAGSYTVVVSNSAGSATSSAATLTVNAATVAPGISTQPGNVTVTAGSAASFTVVASGTAPLTYQWKKDSAAISGATSASFTIASAQSSDAGSYSVTVTNSAGSATSSSATLTVTAAATAPSITTQPSNISVTTGSSATFAIVASGTAPLSYQWYKNGSAISGATSASYTISSAQAADAGSFTCTVTNSAGSVTSAAATLTVTAAVVAPSITTQPISASVTVNASATFSVVASGSSPLSYQWKKDGSAISAATSSSFTLASAQTSDAGTYTCVVSNSAGSATSSGATLTVSAVATGSDETRIINISTRAPAGGYAGTPINGFVMRGSGTKQVLVRAVGPGLIPYGVTNVLPDPSLRLVSGGAVQASNDNWTVGDVTTFSAVGAFSLPVGSLDASLVTTLTAGDYSAPVGYASSASGVVLIEMYDAGSSGDGVSLVNASMRGYTAPGDGVFIVGFVIRGKNTVKLLLRAAGPSLIPFQVTDAVADPVLTLYQSTTALQSNDDWSSATNASEIAAAFTSTGAFAFEAGSRDAAMVVSLSEGVYSMVITGKNSTSGTALGEIYIVKP